MPPEHGLTAAAAAEAIHSASLALDDLPCMDGDRLRRGRPALFVEFGTDIALLVSVTLQGLAFRLLAPWPVLSRSMAGTVIGMAAGQRMDLRAEEMRERDTGEREPAGEADGKAAGKADGLPERAVRDGLKTGALIRWACLAGPSMAGCRRMPAGLALDRFGHALGLAYQAADDAADDAADGAGSGLRREAWEGLGLALDRLRLLPEPFSGSPGAAALDSVARRMLESRLGAAGPD